MEMTAVVTMVARLRNDNDGNPRWQLQLDNGLVFVTEKGAQVGHTITPLLEGKTVTVTVNDAGNITELVER